MKDEEQEYLDIIAVDKTYNKQLIERGIEDFLPNVEDN
jgi:hypothetical protein